MNDGLNDLMQQYRRAVDAAAGSDSDVESFFTAIENNQPETLLKKRCFADTEHEGEGLVDLNKEKEQKHLENLRARCCGKNCHLQFSDRDLRDARDQYALLEPKNVKEAFLLGELRASQRTGKSNPDADGNHSDTLFYQWTSNGKLVYF